MKLIVVCAAILFGVLSSNGLQAAEPVDVAKVASQLLDDTTAASEREALIASHGDQSAALIQSMAKGLGDDSNEEYRRIPWIWRVAIAAGRRNDADELRSILKASLPENEQPLADWQAVVIGGGVINGLTQADVWPAKRITEIIGNDASLPARWKHALELSAKMADHEATPTGTRYDALRMIAMEGWAKRSPQLERYLAPDAHPELQMGAVSGAADIPEPVATKALIKHLPKLTEGNRDLAIAGLLRNEKRMLALLEAIRAGSIPVTFLSEDHRKRLREAKSEDVRKAARTAISCDG